MLDGEEVTTLKVDGQEISVKAEYPEDQYKTVPQLERIILKKPSGGYVALSDVAKFIIRTARLPSRRRISPTRSRFPQIMWTAAPVRQ